MTPQESMTFWIEQVRYYRAMAAISAGGPREQHYSDKLAHALERSRHYGKLIEAQTVADWFKS